MSPAIVFLHGLNTFGDELVHVGPATFGRMDAQWKKALRAQGFDFHSVNGMGHGSIEDQAERAFTWLKRSVALDRDVVLLGQSLGGLVARALVTRPEVKARTKKIFTFGTPHGGAHVTHLALDLREKAPRLNSLLKRVGYDIEIRRQAFQNFTRETIDTFNARHPTPEGIRCVSFLCEVEGWQVSWPLLPVYAKLRQIEKESRGDGFIFSASQSWYETVGPFALDHLGQLGVFLQLSPLHRRAARQEFERLTQAVGRLARE